MVTPTPSDLPLSASQRQVLPLDTILHGDCLDVLRSLPSCSVDAIVTDPPAGVSFMNRSWDSDRGGRDHWVAWLAEVMREALRVLKPGGHALVWALPRTSHWTATALEDAGFEVRDRLAHVFGSGFPKSLDVSKQLDKAAGAQRKVTGFADRKNGSRGFVGGDVTPPITAPATDAARQWDGWGTALKPAVEDWWLVRKPLGESTVAANVLAHGVGALNIGQSRVAHDGEKITPNVRDTRQAGEGWTRPWMEDRAKDERRQVAAYERMQSAGRWPPNLLLSHSVWCLPDGGGCAEGCPVAELDAQSGMRHSAGKYQRGPHMPWVGPASIPIDGMSSMQYSDTGGASRYFPTFRYQAKASRRERNAGCEGLPEVRKGSNYGMDGARPHTKPDYHYEASARNTHPTVKPLALMSWLITLITPPGGIVLDPFAGSGSTLVAAKSGGWRYIGIEREHEYVAIAEARLAATQEPSLGSAVALEPPKPVKPTRQPRRKKAPVSEPLWEMRA